MIPPAQPEPSIVDPEDMEDTDDDEKPRAVVDMKVSPSKMMAESKDTETARIDGTPRRDSVKTETGTETPPHTELKDGQRKGYGNIKKDLGRGTQLIFEKSSLQNAELTVAEERSGAPHATAAKVDATDFASRRNQPDDDAKMSVSAPPGDKADVKSMDGTSIADGGEHSFGNASATALPLCFGGRGGPRIGTSGLTEAQKKAFHDQIPKNMPGLSGRASPLQWECVEGLGEKDILVVGEKFNGPPRTQTVAHALGTGAVIIVSFNWFQLSVDNRSWANPINYVISKYDIPRGFTFFQNPIFFHVLPASLDDGNPLASELQTIVTASGASHVGITNVRKQYLLVGDLFVNKPSQSLIKFAKTNNTIHFKWLLTALLDNNPNLDMKPFQKKPSQVYKK